MALPMELPMDLTMVLPIDLPIEDLLQVKLQGGIFSSEGWRVYLLMELLLDLPVKLPMDLSMGLPMDLPMDLTIVTLNFCSCLLLVAQQFLLTFIAWAHPELLLGASRLPELLWAG